MKAFSIKVEPFRQEPEAPFNNATSCLHPAFTSLAPSDYERQPRMQGVQWRECRGRTTAHYPRQEPGDCKSRDSNLPKSLKKSILATEVTEDSEKTFYLLKSYSVLSVCLPLRTFTCGKS